MDSMRVYHARKLGPKGSILDKSKKFSRAYELLFGDLAKEYLLLRKPLKLPFGTGTKL